MPTLLQVLIYRLTDRYITHAPISLWLGILGIVMGFLIITSSPVWAASDPTQDSCPTGEVWSGNGCTSTQDRTCTTGYVYVATRGCVKENSNICGASGWIMFGGRCQLSSQSCAAGQEWRNGSCQTRDEADCPAGQEMIDDTCQAIVESLCPSGYEWSTADNLCVTESDDGSTSPTASCPTGSVWSGNSCTTVADRTCSTGFVYVALRGCVRQTPGICGLSNYVMKGGRCQDVDEACDAGQVWQNGSCQTRDESSCPAGQEMINGSCRDIIEQTCPYGYLWSTSKNKCVVDPNPPCPIGSFWFGGSCVTNTDLTCPNGQSYMIHQGCVAVTPDICGKSGWTLYGGRCQPDGQTCEADEVWRDGSCQTRDETGCPAGYEMVNGSCRRILADPSCPPGYKWETNRCVVDDGDDGDGDGGNGDGDNNGGGGDNGGGNTQTPTPQIQQAEQAGAAMSGNANTQIDVNLQIRRPVDVYTIEGNPTSWYLMYGINLIEVTAKWKPDDSNDAKPSHLLLSTGFATDTDNDCTKDGDPCVCQTTEITAQSAIVKYTYTVNNVPLPSPPANNPGQWEFYVQVNYNDVAAGTCNAASPQIPAALTAGKTHTAKIDLQ